MSTLVTTTSVANSVKLGDISGISIVDFASFLDGSNKQAVADALLDSFKSVGFAYVVNYGMPKDKVESMFDWVCIVSSSICPATGQMG